MSIALTQTTLSAALPINSNVLAVASATGIAAPINNQKQQLYVIGLGQKRGELMDVVSVSDTQITVARLGEFRAAYPSGSLVLIGAQASTAPYAGGPFFGPGFYAFDPPGMPGTLGTTTDAGNANAGQYSPWINVVTGDQWLYSSLSGCWVPGWQNERTVSPTAAVASVAGLTLPSGPLFHITGGNAITGWTRPIGFSFGKFVVIPDGNFTWTNATNIALAGTAVTSKALEFYYDPVAALWYPSYT